MFKKEKQKEVWIKFENRAAYLEKEAKFLESLREHPGECHVIAYLNQERLKLRLNQVVSVAGITELKAQFGVDNVKEIERETEIYKPSEPARDSMERIAFALEAISITLDSIDQSFDLMSNVLADCQVKNPHGAAIAVTGAIQQI